VLLYYITDRKQFPVPEPRRRERLLAKITEAARAGVDYIQLREKDLPARELESLAREAVRIIRDTRNVKRETRLLINSRSDIALATGADGIHLPSDDISATDARAVCSSVLGRSAKRETRNVIIAVSCHTADEIRLAETQGADFAVFGPVFEKVGTSLRVGLDALRAACRVGHMPVLAIGGVTLENAHACVEAGAAGIAAIRLFQENEIAQVLEILERNENHVARAPSPADVGSNPTRAPSPAGNSQAPLARFFKPSYRRRLPHLQRDYKAIFVTFRTWDSLVLPEAARDVVLKSCLHDHGVKLRLHAAVVMPDHVHLILTALADPTGQQYSLLEILQSLKGASAHAVNKLLERQGPVWQDESFDHVLRSNESLLEKIEYVRQNPVRKGLVTEPRDYRWFWEEEPEKPAGGGARAT
jgi:thiamine-phosphate pyrophosphorylase